MCCAPSHYAEATLCKSTAPLLYETVGHLVIQGLADERRPPALKPLLDEGRKNHRDVGP
jgi:hypothetical protein